MSRLLLPLCLALALPLAGCGDDTSKPASRHDIVTEAVTYTHDGVELEGFLAYDANLSRRRPGVMVVHEWWGLQDHPKESARKLAALGYVAFAADMYGKGKVSDDVEDAKAWSAAFYQDRAGHGRARAKAGLDVLANHELVDKDHLAVIGYCYGGSVALEMAYADFGLEAAVCFHGSLVLPEGPEDEAIETPILVCNGAADAWVGPDAVKAWQEAMDARGAKYAFKSYEGAVHAFTNPGADAREMDNVAYDAAADAASWSDMRAFLKQHLGR
jgi:dienelactone hydrolase